MAMRFTFSREQKLRGRELFDHLYKTGKKRVSHPLTAYAERRADNDGSRIGISVANRCGSAVVRNKMRRRIREAFRLMQHDLPVGTDWLVIVRPHKPLEVAVYQARLRQVLQ